MTFRPHHHPGHLYFVTATLRDWKNVFTHARYANIVLESLRWHRTEGRWRLFAYVLMPSHLHAVVQPLGDYTISGVIQSFGSYTAHRLLEEMRGAQDLDLLRHFAGRRDDDTEKRHQVWHQIQAKNVFTAEFLREKVEYIHNNPMAKQWQLAASRSGYPYSSACYYDEGRVPIVEVDDVRELMW
jgi:putative transposase